MKSHLYSSTICRVVWFVKRFGLLELFLKPLRLTFSFVVIPCLRAQSFEFGGKTFSCLYARYNMTWIGERMVEIPIVHDIIENTPPQAVLEIGNVLSHYFPTCHRVVDKFERGPDVINCDILNFNPREQFDLIVSISTFEHIGFDDDAVDTDGSRILEAITHCQKLLSPSGKLIITFPTGYNPNLDRMLLSGKLGASKINCLKRTGKRKWSECSLVEALARPYRLAYPYGNSVVVAQFNSWHASC